MKLEIYQWLVPLISVFFIARTIQQYRINQKTIRGMIIWIAFWISLILLALVPNWVSFNIAGMLGFKSNVNAVIFIGLGFLFLIVFYLSDQINRLNNRFTELVREIAKERAKSEKGTPQTEEKEIKKGL